MNLNKGHAMFTKSKRGGGLVEETDTSLAAKFLEAGMGFGQGGSVLFHPLEAAYLAKIGKTSFESFASAEKFAAAQEKKHRGFGFAFAVYFSIRKTGRLARPYAKEKDYFRVYAPGVGRLEQRPQQLVFLHPGKVPSLRTLEEQVKIAHLARLDLIVACGTEKEIKFYKVSAFNF